MLNGPDRVDARQGPRVAGVVSQDVRAPLPCKSGNAPLAVRMHARRHLREAAQHRIPGFHCLFAPKCSCLVQGKVLRYNFQRSSAVPLVGQVMVWSLSRGLSSYFMAPALLMQRPSLGPGENRVARA